MVSLKLLAVSLLDDHPQNPRIVYRDDVIDSIVTNLGEEWPQKHALSVRPTGDRYQIMAGHTRKRAATKKGLPKVWCWVDDEISDEAAYMELVTSNAQGELSPLEIGLHCLRCETLAEGGRGKKGGLSAYAEKIGKDESYIRQIRKAAEVLSESSELTPKFLDKTQHLAAIHSLPKACWQACVKWLSENDVPVTNVGERVKSAKAFMDNHGISDQWVKTYLKLTDCTATIFCGTRPTVFAMLDKLATEVLESLASHEDLSKQWMEWLLGNVGQDS